MSARVSDEKLREMETWITRPEVACAAAELRELRGKIEGFRRNGTYRCLLCGATGVTVGWDDHLKACPSHPMRAVEKERDELRAQIGAVADLQRRYKEINALIPTDFWPAKDLPDAVRKLVEEFNAVGSRAAALRERLEALDVEPRPWRDGDEWSLIGTRPIRVFDKGATYVGTPMRPSEVERIVRVPIVAAAPESVPAEKAGAWRPRRGEEVLAECFDGARVTVIGLCGERASLRYCSGEIRSDEISHLAPAPPPEPVGSTRVGFHAEPKPGQLLSPNGWVDAPAEYTPAALLEMVRAHAAKIVEEEAATPTELARLDARVRCLEDGHSWKPGHDAPEGELRLRVCDRCARREVYVQPETGGWMVSR